VISFATNEAKDERNSSWSASKCCGMTPLWRMRAPGSQLRRAYGAPVNSSDTPFALVLDVGGTKIAAGGVTADGTVHHRVQVSTPTGAADDVWAGADEVLRSVLEQLGLGSCVGVGIGTAGPIDRPTGSVSPVNIPGWRGFPIVDRVRRLVGDRPVRLAGDAVCVAVGEHWRGAGRGCDDMVGMVVSTGVGGGLVLGGRPHVGPSGNAGHIGHISVDLAGPPCACGGVGCVEAIASGRSLAAWAVAEGYTGEPTAAAVAAAARAGDPIANAAYVRAGRAIGSMLAGLATVCDVRVAVIGGGVANAGELLFAPIRDSFDRYAAFDYARGFDIRVATLGGDAGLVGAAALVLDPALRDT
jgi:glucokinase